MIFPRSFPIAAAALLASATLSPAAPLPLLPGTTLPSIDYFDFGEVPDGDPDWFGTVLETGTATANETRDGFVIDEVVEDLYDVDAIVDWTVTRATNGQLVFAHDFSGADNGFVGTNGVLGFDLNGFAGYDIGIGWNAPGAPYVPTIERSANGETVSVGFFDPRDILFGIETLLIVVDAPDYRTTGTGTAGIEIDSFGTITSPLSGPLPIPAPIPLPAGAVLMLGALGLLGLTRRRST